MGATVRLSWPAFSRYRIRDRWDTAGL